MGLAILELLYVCTKTEQISKLIVGTENQLAHCQRKVPTNRKEKRLQ